MSPEELIEEMSREYWDCDAERYWQTLASAEKDKVMKKMRCALRMALAHINEFSYAGRVTEEVHLWDHFKEVL